MHIFNSKTHKLITQKYTKKCVNKTRAILRSCTTTKNQAKPKTTPKNQLKQKTNPTKPYRTHHTHKQRKNPQTPRIKHHQNIHIHGKNPQTPQN